jgi:osmotically-inducible protein OsmY
MAQLQQETDQEIKESIDHELDWASNVNAERIGVAVTDGAVTLSGQVLTYPEKEAALDAARRVRRVRAVADKIVVQHAWGVPDDADIAREAGVAVNRTVIVPPGSVKATVHEHVITLSGEVNWQYQRQAAQRAVTDLPGVSAVWNSITIKPSIPISAAETKEKISAALVRNARLDSEGVQVSVRGSTVQLTGSVSSLAERTQAEDAAWFAPGVARVDNELTIVF